MSQNVPLTIDRNATLYRKYRLIDDSRAGNYALDMTGMVGRCQVRPFRGEIDTVVLEISITFELEYDIDSNPVLDPDDVQYWVMILQSTAMANDAMAGPASGRQLWYDARYHPISSADPAVRIQEGIVTVTDRSTE